MTTKISAQRANRNPIQKRAQLHRLGGRRLPTSIGNKAANLQLLISKKFLVPDTYVLTWDAYQDYQKEGTAVLAEIKSELCDKLNPMTRYAVRSSANVEDSIDHSFAGQFSTVLNVQGIDRLLEAIQEVWKAACSENIIPYLQQSQTNREGLRMAVIIQRMVQPVVSGVSFSINPITSLDEVVVEAVFGSGEQLVQEGVTPLRWVNKWGKWIEKPENDPVKLEVVQKVVDETQKISKAFKMNVDLEWVYDGNDIYWVQMRDITAVVKADIYSNKIAKEMTPGLVKPLEWSVVVPIKSAMWINRLNQVTGESDIHPESLAKMINYRVYHNLGVFGRIFESLGLPRESLDIMMGVAPPGAGKPPFKPGRKFFRLMPHIVGFLWEMWNFAKKAESDFPLLQAEVRKYSLAPSQDLQAHQLLALIDQVKELNLWATTNLFLSIILMQIYCGILSAQLKKVGVDFAQFDLKQGLDELNAYDPNTRLEALNRQYLQFNEPIRRQIKHADWQVFKQMDGIEGFRKDVEIFLTDFGHMSDRTVMFDTVPWRETPGLILDLIANFEGSRESPFEKISYSQVPQRGLVGLMIKTFYKRARQFCLFRERYSSLYTYSLMLFRVYYLAVADRLLNDGLLDAREDIYFLYDREIRDYVNGNNSGTGFRTLIKQRMEEMERCKDALTPEIIYGDSPPPVVIHPNKKLTGTPTSRGYYTGKTKVVRGLGDFHKLNNGDVLVIPYSDVGWIPLFAKAGAVVAESGGMLSHSSIVAREYGIPAVVSVSGALQLQDDLVVSIDGYTGEVLVHAVE